MDQESTLLQSTDYPFFINNWSVTISTILNELGSVNDEEQLIESVKDSLAMSLQLGDRVRNFTADTRLLGELPELDSMAVLTVLSGLEEQFGITIDDDDISAETFETVGTIVSLVKDKLD